MPRDGLLQKCPALKRVVIGHALSERLSAPPPNKFGGSLRDAAAPPRWVGARACRASWDGGYLWCGPRLTPLWPKTLRRNLSGDRSAYRRNRNDTGERGRATGCAARRTTGGATSRFLCCRNAGSVVQRARGLKAVAASLRHSWCSSWLPVRRKRPGWIRG